MNKKDQLFSVLHQVFPLRPLPERVFNTESHLLDYEDELNEHILGKEWALVERGFWTSHGIMRTHDRNLIEPEALHYYSPSVIADVLVQPDFAQDFTSLILPPKGKEQEALWQKFRSLFTKEQAQAIVDCIYYLDEKTSQHYGDWYTSSQEYHDFDRALDLW
ncbi:MAG: hypothetical protein ACRBHB_12135 [Arenicella sp.]